MRRGATLAGSLVGVAAVAALVGCRPIDIHPDDRVPAHVIQTQWRLLLHRQPPLAYFPKETATPAYGHSGKVVVAGSEAGDVVAADSRSGRVLWRHRTEGKIRGSAAIRGGRVYVGSTDGRLYALDLRTGKPLWEKPYRTNGAISSQPAVGGGLVLFQNNENRVYAIDAKTGEYKWDQGRPRPDFFTIKGEGGPAVADKTAYAGFEDGTLVAIGLSDGASIWSKNLAASETQFVDIDTRPVVEDDVLYVGCFNVGVYAVGREHGDIRWLHRVRGAQTPALGEGLLYVATGSRHLEALDTASGDVRWRVRLHYGELSAPTVAGERLFVSTGSGILWMDAQTGTIRARISPDEGQAAQAASSRGLLHFVTNSGDFVGARLIDL